MLQFKLNRLRESVMARNAAWMMCGQASNLVLQAAYFAVLARLLGSTEYGVFIGAFALTGVLSAYGSMGSGTILLRYVSTGKGRFAAYWGNVLLTTTLLGGAVIALATCASPLLLNARSASLVLLAGIANCFFSEVTRNSAMVFQAFEEMRITAIISIGTSVARLAAAVILLVTLRHASALGWAFTSMIVSGAVAGVAAITASIRYGWPELSASLMLKRIPEGFSYSFASSANSVYNDVDKSMLSHYGMNEANGVYALAYRVIDAATSPVYAMRDAVVPRFFRESSRDVAGLKRLTLRVTARACVTSVAISLTLYLFAPLIPVIAGPSFTNSVQALRWLCMIPILRSVHQITGSAVMGMGKQNYRTASQLVVAAANFVINLYWIPMYGWKGAAWSSLIADGLLALSNLVLFQMLCRRASERISCLAGV
jgi:O-antigen/teichoic acid export membrane protein